MSNYFFNVASSVLLIAIAGFLIDRVREPRLGRQGISRTELVDDDDPAAPVTLSATLTPAEIRGLRWSFIVGLVLSGAIVVAAVGPDSLRPNEDGGFLPSSLSRAWSTERSREPSAGEAMCRG